MGERRARRRTSPSSSPRPSTTLANLRRVVICKPEPKGGRQRHQDPHVHAGGEGPRRAEDTARHGGDPPGPVRHVDQRASTSSSCTRNHDRVQRQVRAAGDWPLADESVQPQRRRLRGTAAPRRGRDAQDRVPPLPQLHPRQRGHAEGRRVLAVPLPAVRQDARRAREPADRPAARVLRAALGALQRRGTAGDQTADRRRCSTR